nr:hypothetical protein [Tanacetum cinerariifolium]
TIESFLSKRRETTKELAAGRLDFAVDAPLNTDPQRAGLCRSRPRQDGHSAQSRPALAALLDGLPGAATDRHGHDRPRALRPAQRSAFCVLAGERRADRGNAPLLARKHRPGPGQPLDARADHRTLPIGDRAGTQAGQDP